MSSTKKKKNLFFFLSIWLKLVLVVSFVSCSIGHFEKRKKTISKKSKFVLIEPSGKYSLLRKSGITSSRDFVTKEELFHYSKWREAPLEKGIMISSHSNYSETIGVILPKASQRIFWFDKKKYFTESKFSFLKKEAKFSWKSPIEREKSVRTVELDDSKKLYCFLGQLIDCIKETGFFKKSKMKRSGTMYFSLVFDGYPFFNEQYGLLKNSPIVESDFSFEKDLSKGTSRYSLSFLDQTITYIVDRGGNLIDKFWISHGLSLKKVLKN